MEFSILQTAIFNDSIRYIHLIAVAIGLGVSFLADISVLHRMKRPLSAGFMAALHSWHRIVTYALIVMWLSGAMLIYMRTGFVLADFSPKLIGKVIVVSLLTLNSILISVYAMPKLDRAIGDCPINMPMGTKLPMAMISGMSTTSWLLALTLGSSVVLKTASAAVFIALLPACYAIGLIASVMAIGLMHRNATKPVTAR